MNWFLTALKKYAVFAGRAQRAEYWYFILIYVIIALALNYLDRALGLTGTGGDTGILTTLFGLAMLLPTLAVGARRLHDTGRSAWWLLLALVPLIGSIVLLVFFVLDSQPGDNRYGPNPKGVMA